MSFEQFCSDKVGKIGKQSFDSNDEQGEVCHNKRLCRKFMEESQINSLFWCSIKSAKKFYLSDFFRSHAELGDEAGITNAFL